MASNCVITDSQIEWICDFNYLNASLDGVQKIQNAQRPMAKEVLFVYSIL